MEPYYKTNLGALYEGDAAIVIPQLNEQVDMVLTSPPYDALRDYKGYEFNFKAIACTLKEILKPGGVLVWVVGDETINGSETGTSFKQALYFKELGLNLHDTMIYKKMAQGAVGSNKAYWSNFEYMFIFVNGKIGTFNPIRDQQNSSSGRRGFCGGRRNTNGKVNPNNKYRIRQKLSKRTNVWEISEGHRQHDHPAPFPNRLAHDHIISWTNKGNLVLDCLAGRGTTLKQAQILKRRWYGIEISGEYCNIIKTRMQKTMKKERLRFSNKPI